MLMRLAKSTLCFTCFLLYPAIANANELTIVNSGGANQGSGWTYDPGSGILQATSDVSVNRADIESLLTSDLDIQATDILLNASLTSANGTSLTFSALNNISISADLSNVGDINLLAGNNFSTPLTSRFEITSGDGNITISADSDANGVGVLDIDYLTVDAGSGDIVFRTEQSNWSTADASHFPIINGSGSFVYESSDDSLGTGAYGGFDTGSWVKLNADGSTFSSFRIGKSTNLGTVNATSNADGTSSITVAGPFELNASSIAIDINVTTTAENAAILIKSKGAISVAEAHTLQTNNGDIILWSDSDANNEGRIQFLNDVTLNSINGSTATNLITGGNIIIAGGNDNGANGGDLNDGIPDNFASSATGVGLGLNSDGDGNTTIHSGGGNVHLFGYSSNSNGLSEFNNGIQQFGGLFIHSNTGRIKIIGESVHHYGINFNQNSAASQLKLELKSSADSGDAIYVKGTSQAALGTVFNYSSIKQLIANGGGNITIEGTGGGINAGIFFQSTDVLATSGNIDINGNVNGLQIRSVSNSFGSKTGSSVLTSSSDITFTGDAFTVESGGTASLVTTTGNVTFQPHSASFSAALNYPFANLTVHSGIGGLVLGKTDNASDINVTSITAFTEDVTIHANNIGLTGALTATSGTLSLHATGNVTQSAAITAQSLSLNGAGSFVLQNNANNVVSLAAGASDSRTGAISYRDSNALTVGTVGSQNGIYSSGAVLVETESGTLTLSQGIDTTTTDDSAITLNAGRPANMGAAAGGDIVVSGSPVISFPATTKARLFSGSPANSTGLDTFVGSSNKRGYVDESSGLPQANLQDNNTYALYRDGSSFVDTDGDGVVDATDTDDDNDGVSDAAEASAGTDPRNPLIFSNDADNDWVSDEQEASDGTDPNDANSFIDANNNRIPDSLEPHICLADDFSASSLDASWAALSGGNFTPAVVNIANNNRLRVTDDDSFLVSAISKDIKIPANRYLVFDLESAAYGGVGSSGVGSDSEHGADGVAVILSDYSVTPALGGAGGALGFMPGGVGIDGYAGGWLAVGITEYRSFTGLGGDASNNNAITIRGSGNGQTGYGVIRTVAGLTPAIGSAGVGGSSETDRYRITIDSSNGTNSYVTVERDSGSGFGNIITNEDVLAASGQASLPENLRIAFSGATGAATNNHEFDNLRVLSPNCASAFSNITIQNGRISNDLSQTSFDVVLSRPVPTGETVTVQYQTANGTAQAGTDFTAVSTTTLTFSEGEQTKTINVNMIDISSDDDGKTFDIRLSNPVPSGSAFLGLGNLTYTIRTTDTDGDGILDQNDTDDDNDGVPDQNDTTPTVYGATDSDNDGVPDYFDLGGAGFSAGIYVDASGNVLDSDNDGVNDYVEAFPGPNNAPSFNNLNASFTAFDIDTSIANGRGLDVADIDGDGDLDFVAAQADPAVISIYTNDGSASFAKTTLQSFSGRGVWFLEFADVNHDGFIDIVGAENSANSRILTFLHTGNNSAPYTTNSAILSADVGNSVTMFDLFDVTNDGRIDVVFAVVGDSTLEYIANDGDNTPFSGTPVLIDNSLNGVRPVIIDDSGNVFAAGQNDGEIALFVNNGTSSPFSAKTTIDTVAGSAPIYLQVGDIDGDASQDLLVLNEGSDEIVHYEYNGVSYVKRTLVDAQLVDTTSPFDEFGPHSLAFGDIDLDGDNDFLITSYQSDDIIWFKNNGQGTFGNASAQFVLNGTTENPLEARFGDFNADGISDFVAMLDVAGEIELYTGSLSQNISIEENTTLVGNVQAFDQDGDTITYSRSGADASLFTIASNGDLSFVNASDEENPTDAGGDNVYNVTVTASDGKGGSLAAEFTITVINDTTAANFTNNTPSLNALSQNSLSMNYETNEAGTVYTLVGTLSSSTPTAATVVTGNVTGDYIAAGNQAITANTAITSTISGLNQTGNAFKLRVYSVVRDSEGNNSAVSTTIVEYRDTDGDGIPDSTDTDDDGDGVPDADDNSRAIFGATDSDGDGIPDYFDLNGNGYVQGIYVDDSGTPLDTDGDGVSDYIEDFPGVNDAPVFNEVNSSFTSSIIDNNISSRTVAIADIDNDGFDDIVTASQDINAVIRWYKNDQAGGFGAPITITNSVTSNIRFVATGDINNDGFVDIAYAGFGDSEIGYIMHSGNTGNPFGGQTEITFTPIATSGGLGIETISLADMTNDGLLDFVAVDNGNSRVFYVENDADSTPFDNDSVVLIATDMPNPRGMTVVDFDGDADLDVLVGSMTNNQIRLYTNDGSSTPFGSVNSSDTNIVTLSAGVAIVQAADLDGDGELEIFSSDGNSLVYQRNNGDSTYTQVVVADNAVISGLHSISFGDVDYDNDIDLLITDYLTDDIIWFENDGNGGFGNSSANIVFNGNSSDNPLEAVFADFNKDGVSDFVSPLDVATDLVVYTGSLNASLTFNENVIEIEDISARDPDGHSVSYSLSGADSALFEISATGQLSFRTAPDFENPTDANTDDIYEVSVTASDDQTPALSRTAAFTVTIINDTTGPVFRNSTPSEVSISNTTATYRLDINEASTVYGMLLEGGANCPSIADLKSGNNSVTGFINAQNGTISTSPTTEDLTFTGIDIDTSTTYELCFVASDAEPNDGMISSLTLTIADTDGDGVLNRNDNDDDGDGIPDSDDNTPTTYGATDTDGDGVPDYYDLGGDGYVQDIFVDQNGDPLDTDGDGINDYIEAFPGANDPPVITSNGGGATANVSVAENTASVTTIAANDVDGNSISYSLSGGADQALFTLTGANLTFTNSPNFESPQDSDNNNTYQVEVTATDNGAGQLSDSQMITVTVTNGNEAPVIISNGGGANVTINVAENSLAVTTLLFTDEDGNGVSFSLTGGADKALFSLSGNALSFVNSPDFESPTDSGNNNTYVVQVTAKENAPGTLSDSQNITVKVTDVNEGPPDSDGDGIPDMDDSAPNDPRPDSDGDGIVDEEDSVPNDPRPDTDGDGIVDEEDSLPNDPRPDSDGDGIIDAEDSAPNDPRPDTDGDGIVDEEDAFPNDPKESVDSDGDGMGDNSDAFPNDPNEFRDSDGDGIGDNSDGDRDGDGVPNSEDDYPNDATRSGDIDSDGVDDAYDDDMDGDGIPNDQDLDADGNGIIDDIEGNTAPVANSDVLDINAVGSVTIDVLSNDEDADQDTLTIVSVSTRQGQASIVDNQIVYSAPENYKGSAVISYSITDNKQGFDSTVVLVNIDTFDESGDAPLVLPPEDVAVNATGLFTKVNLGVATATDSNGNPLPVSLVDGVTLFKPGVNTAYWEAIDSNGARSVSSQQVIVRPLVSFGKNQIVKVGESVTVPVLLNGESPVYPLQIGYRIVGSLDLLQRNTSIGTLVIQQGNRGEISLQINDDLVFDGNRTLRLEFTGELNSVSNSSHEITISSSAQAPSVELVALQQGEKRFKVSQNGGMVSLQATVEPASQGHAFTWDVVNSMIDIDQSNRYFTFDPAAVAVGVYKLAVTVDTNDSFTPSVTQTIELAVVESLATLSQATDSDFDNIPDEQEGYNDEDGDGIADFADSIKESNVLPSVQGIENAFLLEADPGLSLRIGSKNILSNNEGALLVDSAKPAEDIGILNIGGMFDFEIRGLEEIGQTANIVVPQRRAIVEGVKYRKYTEELGWFDFVIDQNNTIYSAPGELGYCPPPASEQWREGLNTGDFCVRLSIEDGGPNDADGIANGTIIDPSGMGIELVNNSLPVLQNDIASVLFNTDVEIDVLANDSDPDGDMLEVVEATTDFGSVEITANKLVFTPIADYFGQVSIQYAVDDGFGVLSYAFVEVDIYVNKPPVVVNDTATTDDMTPIVVDVLSNDSDAEGGTLKLVNVSSSVGTATIEDNQISFVPVKGMEAIVEVSYTVSDEQGFESEGMLTVSVTPVVSTLVPEEPEQQSSGGGSLNVVFILGLLVIAFVRRFRGSIRHRVIMTLNADLFSLRSKNVWTLRYQNTALLEYCNEEIAKQWSRRLT